ncbi:MAG: hypothetical protein FJW88_13920 [Actinobacteria bacterium]|nr:hypothetical protein [Actinomycetota bacterium]
MGAGADALTRVSEGDAPAAVQSETGRSRADSTWLILVVGGVLAVGIGLRLFARSDLWADEALSVNIARLPLSELRPALRHDGAPPLYYLLLHFWITVFGTGDFSARALSGVLGIATLVPMWFAGRRLDRRRAAAGLQGPDARPVAWAALLLFASSPFAIRYATEARMYALLILLVVLGYLAVLRSLDRPSWGRLLVVALVAGLLVYTHYWSFALLVVVGAWLVACAVRGDPARRRAAWSTVVAIGLGCVTFLAWLPTFWFQVVHTGTPWGSPIGPVASVAEAFKSFGGNTHAAGWALLLVALLAVFARAVDANHFEVDLRTRPGVRVEAGIGLAVLGLGLAMSRLSGTTFEGRYAAVMFPLFLLSAAFGLTVFASRPVRYAVMVVLIVLGFWGGASNALRNRTQAFQVADVLSAQARPDDLVVYCPDAIGTDVARLAPDGLREVGFPDMTRSSRIDWADYARRVDEADPEQFARRLLRRAGPEAQVWLVYTDGEARMTEQCSRIADTLALLRPERTRVIEPDPYFFEHHGLYRYPAETPAPSS